MTLTEATDTAVILALYILHGPTAEFFERLNGEFAFVIWDAQRRKFVAARDRFGVKPLFWYYDTCRLVFASEIKAILSVDGIDRKFSTGTRMIFVESTTSSSYRPCDRVVGPFFCPSHFSATCLLCRGMATELVKLCLSEDDGPVKGVSAVHPGKYLTMDLTHGSWDAPKVVKCILGVLHH